MNKTTLNKTCFLLLIGCLFFSISAMAQVGNYDAEIEKIANTIAAKISAANIKKITISEFVNVDENITELGRDIADDVETYLLSSNYAFSIVSRRELTRILEEQKISRSRITEKENVSKIGKISNVQAIIVGSISDRGEQIRVNVQILEVESAVKTGAAFGKITATETIKRKFNRVIEYKTHLEKSTNTPKSSKTQNNYPIEKTVQGGCKIRLTNVAYHNSKLTIDFKFYNAKKNTNSKLYVYAGTFNNKPTNINIKGNLYESNSVKIGNTEKNRTPNQSYNIAKSVVSGQSWTNGKIIIDDVPDIKVIDILNISLELSYVGSMTIDFRNIPVNNP